jgi:hypothetical protein
MVERAGDLRSDLVELIGRDVEIFMGRPKLFAGLLKGSAGRLAEPECPHELQACQLFDSFHSLRAGFSWSLGFSTIASLKRSTTIAIAFTPPRRS